MTPVLGWQRDPVLIGGLVTAALVYGLLVGPLRKYRAIHARTVARAMLKLAKEPVAGVRVVESDEIEALGK